MRPVQKSNWQAKDLTTPLTGEVAPPAAQALLAQADAWPVAVAVAPYAGCAHIFDGLSESGLEDRYLAAVIAPAAVNARAALTRTFGGAVYATDPYHSMWSDYGGTTGNDVIRVPWFLTPNWGLPVPAFQVGVSDIALSGASSIPGPTEPTDRMIELDTQGVPYVEPLFITLAAGFSLGVVEQIADLEVLNP